MAIFSFCCPHCKKTINVFAGKSREEQQEEWEKTDWSKSNPEIARLLGVSVATVHNRRCTLAPDTRVYKKRASEEDWKTVDWTKTNGDIAKKMKVSLATVYQKRVVFAPKTIRRWKRK